MSSRSNNTSTYTPHPHYQPHLPNTPADYFSVRMWKYRNPQNQVASGLMNQYNDLIMYEPQVGQIVSRLPMILRCGNNSETKLPRDAKDGLSLALASWSEAEHFYSSVQPKIESKTAKNSELFITNNVELYKAACLTLLEYQDAVRRGHACLIMTIKGLYQGGYTYSAIMPVSERRYYRFSA